MQTRNYCGFRNMDNKNNILFLTFLAIRAACSDDFIQGSWGVIHVGHHAADMIHIAGRFMQGFHFIPEMFHHICFEGYMHMAV